MAEDESRSARARRSLNRTADPEGRHANEAKAEEAEARSIIPEREAPENRPLAVTAMRMVEKMLLLAVAALTVLAAGVELWRVWEERTVALADLLLMFLYAEVIGMVAVFYISRTTPLFYPIFIAITAVARLIVLQSKDMDPLNIIYEAGAILLLGATVAVLKQFAER
jgi:protein PsiE